MNEILESYKEKAKKGMKAIRENPLEE